MQQEGVPQTWGTNSGPRAHLGRGTNPQVGPTILMCLHANLIASVCLCKERMLGTPEAGTLVARFRFWSVLHRATKV